jgi:hypothetical protein
MVKWINQEMSNMSTQDREPVIISEFRELYKYVYDVGRYVNRIYEHLDGIETQLKEISDKFDERTALNSKDISEIQEKMITKSEFDKFVDTLRAKVEEKLPSLPDSQTPHQ